MLYQFYEMQQAALTPVRYGAEIARTWFQNPFNPLSYTQVGRTLGANAELLERVTRKFGKPIFGLSETIIDGRKVEVIEKIVDEKPFCNLMRFYRRTRRNDPKVLVVAPMSGHYATLLRGTVEALLPHHQVYITDWNDARQVPLHEGKFNLDTYVAYLKDYIEMLGPDVHLIAVCQPAVPVFMVASIMASENNPKQAATMTLMGGPIDPRISKTAVTELAEQRPLSWFEHAVTADVPAYYPGAFRKVYPGFIQLGGFMSMNLDRHVGSHLQFYNHLVQGDGDSAEMHRKFYNEYLAVMDITAEFYLQTVEEVFQKHSLAKGTMKWRNPEDGNLYPVNPQDIQKTALLTIEGELDDISALGQTMAAHDLASNLPANMQYHHLQEDVGHYGIFNGRRWRNYIMPRVRNFIRKYDKDAPELPAKDLKSIPDIAVRRWSKARDHVSVVSKELKKKQKAKAKKK